MEKGVCGECQNFLLCFQTTDRMVNLDPDDELIEEHFDFCLKLPICEDYKEGSFVLI